MLTAVCQRWRDRRDHYRPAGEVVSTATLDVAPIEQDATVKAFVERHHYAASYPAARFRFGLFDRGELVGVAVFSDPFPAAVQAARLPGTPIELSRFVLLDRVPANAETWTLARCWDLLRHDADMVLSFSDPMPRRSASGSLVFAGHIGTIYQAHNGVFLGQANPRTVRLLPDGHVLSARAIQKIRSGDRGWRYSMRMLVAHGAEPLLDPTRGREWVATWLPRLTRTARHPGNLRYAWALDRRLRRHMPAGEPYRKFALAAGGEG